jgi:predicted permease
LSYLLGLFANNILPIFLASASGYLLARYVKVNPRSISQLAFYNFSPRLVIKLLTSSQLNHTQILRMGGFDVAGILLIGLLAWIVERLFHFEAQLYHSQWNGQFLALGYVEPSLVSSVGFTSTLLSPLTLTPLLAYLGA